MSQSKLLALAQQGDPQAIATLMNRSLTPKGITATISLASNRLEVVLEATVIPEQQPLTLFVRSRIASLQIQGIDQIQIQGQQTGATEPAWTETVTLPAPRPASPRPASRSGTYPKTSPVTHISATALLPVDGTVKPTDVNRLRWIFIGGTVFSLLGFILIQLVLVDSGFLNPQNPLLMVFSFVFLLGNFGPLGFLVGFLLAFIPAVIALDKDRDFSLWWLYGLHLLGPAIVHALILRPLTTPSATLLPTQQVTICPYCAEILRGTVTTCSGCGQELPLQKPN